MMETDERQFMLTAAWLFARHGQGARARTLLAALVEDNPRDGIVAAAYAEQLLVDHEPDLALQVLRAADFPSSLARAEALLETRALTALGKKDDAERRWRRYVEQAKGAARTWVG